MSSPFFLVLQSKIFQQIKPRCNRGERADHRSGKKFVLVLNFAVSAANIQRVLVFAGDWISPVGEFVLDLLILASDIQRILFFAGGW